MCAEKLAATFHRLEETLSEETGGLSIIQKKVRHPAYQEIIALGPPALPLILHEMEREPAHWFWALSAISGENPVRSGMSFQEAVDIWRTELKHRPFRCTKLTPRNEGCTPC